jgi:hypothetical protein
VLGLRERAIVGFDEALVLALQVFQRLAHLVAIGRARLRDAIAIKCMAS